MAWSLRRGHGSHLAFLAVVLSSGCAGSGGPSEEDPPAPPPGMPDADTTPDPGCAPSLERSALARLTHRQWGRTVEDLLRLPPGTAAPLVARFVPDPTSGGFDNDASLLRTPPSLGRDHRRAAGEIASLVARDPTLLAGVAPCAVGDDADPRDCGASAVAGILDRAFRRPATDAEVERYAVLLLTGARIADDDIGPAAGGVELLIEAVLQSPKFLYRRELDALDAEGTDGARALDGYEVASRLSYFLWGTMPDDALFAAAAAGNLDTAEGVRGEATRMIDDPRAGETVADFHAQWLGSDAWTELLRDPEDFGALPPTLSASMRASTARFVEDVVTADGAGLAALLTHPVAFVNEDLAPLYGLGAVTGDALARRALDPAERAGILTQVGFLAHHADFRDPSPIRRGVFVQRRILCTAIPDPPGDADLDLPAAGGTHPTNRDRVEAHTAADGCQVCHRLINQTGFPFETYDALGAWRTHDRSVPVDSRGDVPIGLGAPVAVDDAVALSHALAGAPQAHACYATKLTRYATGRAPTDEDACVVDALAADSEAGTGTLDLLVTLATSEAMRFRRPDGPLDDGASQEDGR